MLWEHITGARVFDLLGMGLKLHLLLLGAVSEPGIDFFAHQFDEDAFRMPTDPCGSKLLQQVM